VGWVLGVREEFFSAALLFRTLKPLKLF